MDRFLRPLLLAGLVALGFGFSAGAEAPPPSDSGKGGELTSDPVDPAPEVVDPADGTGEGGGKLPPEWEGDPDAPVTEEPAPEDKPGDEPAPEKPGEGEGEIGTLDATNDGSADTREGVQEQMAPLPVEIGNSGSFNYAVPIDVPAFHGIEPHLAFSYDSARKSVGSPDAIMGVGWQLSGLSKITRNTVGGGLPTYVQDEDIFRLDGTDLLACQNVSGGASFAYPYPWVYPPNRIATQNNASCSLNGSAAGAGNMVTLQANNKRIRAEIENYNGMQVRRFVVTDMSGRQYIYRAPGVISPNGGPVWADSTPEFKMIYNSVWLLSEIRDTQTRPNIVQFHYSFDRSEG